MLIETGSRDISTDASASPDGSETSSQPKNDADLDRMFQLFDYASDCIVDGVVAQDMK